MTKQKTEAQYYSDESLPQKFANPVNIYINIIEKRGV